MSHPTHKTRYSDSSLYDEVCTLCGVTDANGMALLDAPCTKAPKVSLACTAFGQLAGGGPSTLIDCTPVQPLEPKKAVEMVAGKKYLLVVTPPENVSQDALSALARWTAEYGRRLRECGIDAEVIVAGFPLSVYELEKCRD